jgi:hypothetical protein
MPSSEVRRLRRTVNKIDALRLRTQESRSSSSRCIPIEDTLERDIILKALELLRETITVGNAMREQEQERR